MALDYFALSAATDSGLFQATTDIVTNTDKRDLSDMLDLLAIADTPFINRIGWGAESAAQKIEWIYENLGPGYVIVGSGAASTATSIQISTVEGLTTAEAAKQLQSGTILYGYNSTNGEHAFFVVVSTGTDGEIEIEVLSSITGVSQSTDIAAGDYLYILGAAANEASLPRTGNWRPRALAENYFTILRQDVQISGSMQETEMYAIGREDLHQIAMRLKEMQRDRERMALYSLGVAVSSTNPRSTTEASLLKGALGFLASQTGSEIDTTTTTLTESAVNTVVGACWESGANKLTFYGHKDQCAKFTQWDKNRIRTAVNEGRGGGYITKYLCEVPMEIDIVPLKKVPKNIAFLIDDTKCKLRAKRNRKAIMKKLGAKGDFDEWQILSEFSMEMKGYNLHQHGIFTKLS